MNTGLPRRFIKIVYLTHQTPNNDRNTTQQKIIGE
jgi:hypothetical protein